MNKSIIRGTKYTVWFLVNIVICIIPIAISAFIARKIDDTIISSYISYAYTLLISGIYVHKSMGREKELLFWITLIAAFILLVVYVFFPNLLSAEAATYARTNFINISLISLAIILILALFLNFQSIEDQVQKTFNDRVRNAAHQTEDNVKGYFNTLKDEQP